MGSDVLIFIKLPFKADFREKLVIEFLEMSFALKSKLSLNNLELWGKKIYIET